MGEIPRLEAKKRIAKPMHVDQLRMRRPYRASPSSLLTQGARGCPTVVVLPKIMSISCLFSMAVFFGKSIVGQPLEARIV
jgi:hypothetical protein